MTTMLKKIPDTAFWDRDVMITLYRQGILIIPFEDHFEQVLTEARLRGVPSTMAPYKFDFPNLPTTNAFGLTCLPVSFKMIEKAAQSRLAIFHIMKAIYGNKYMEITVESFMNVLLQYKHVLLKIITRHPLYIILAYYFDNNSNLINWNPFDRFIRDFDIFYDGDPDYYEFTEHLLQPTSMAIINKAHELLEVLTSGKTINAPIISWSLLLEILNEHEDYLSKSQKNQTYQRCIYLVAFTLVMKHLLGYKISEENIDVIVKVLDGYPLLDPMIESHMELRAQAEEIDYIHLSKQISPTSPFAKKNIELLRSPERLLQPKRREIRDWFRNFITQPSSPLSPKQMQFIIKPFEGLALLPPRKNFDESFTEVPVSMDTAEFNANNQVYLDQLAHKNKQEWVVDSMMQKQKQRAYLKAVAIKEAEEKAMQEEADRQEQERRRQAELERQRQAELERIKREKEEAERKEQERLKREEELSQAMQQYATSKPSKWTKKTGGGGGNTEQYDMKMNPFKSDKHFEGKYLEEERKQFKEAMQTALTSKQTKWSKKAIGPNTEQYDMKMNPFKSDKHFEGKTVKEEKKKQEELSQAMQQYATSKPSIWAGKVTGGLNTNPFNTKMNLFRVKQSSSPFAAKSSPILTQEELDTISKQSMSARKMRRSPSDPRLELSTKSSPVKLSPPQPAPAPILPPPPQISKDGPVYQSPIKLKTAKEEVTTNWEKKQWQELEERKQPAPVKSSPVKPPPPQIAKDGPVYQSPIKLKTAKQEVITDWEKKNWQELEERKGMIPRSNSDSSLSYPPLPSTPPLSPSPSPSPDPFPLPSPLSPPYFSTPRVPNSPDPDPDEPPFLLPSDIPMKMSYEMKLLHSLLSKWNKDIRHINQCVTKQGAEEYIAKNKKKNWHVYEDSNHNVYVSDSYGYVRIINGYCLAKSEYMMKKAYYAENPTAQERNKLPYNRWKSDKKKLIVNMNTDGSIMSIKPQTHLADTQFDYLFDKITPKKMFGQLFLEPLFYKNQDIRILPNAAQAYLYTIVLNVSYKECVLKKVIQEDLSIYSREQQNRIKKSYEPQLFDYIKRLANNPIDTYDYIQNLMIEVLQNVYRNLEETEGAYYDKVKPLTESEQELAAQRFTTQQNITNNIARNYDRRLEMFNR